MLSLAEALSEFADVTLAFRHVPGRPLTAHEVLAIEPVCSGDGNTVDEVAQRGLNPLSHLAYLRRLATFSRDGRQRFDVVLEKGWRLSGTLLSAFRRHGIPGVLIENDVRAWSEPIRDLRSALKYSLHLAGHAVARRHWTRTQIIAETEELKTMLVRRGAQADCVDVVGLGVDHRLFRPRDQVEARRILGIGVSTQVYVYVGGMDKYHDLGPVIEALSTAPPDAELHVVGDGVGRAECERQARRLGAPVRFHGRVAHVTVPTYIAAADACISAYREEAFPGAITFSTLKVPEYMACARPVIGNAAGEARALLEDLISGFIFPNNVAAWTRFFRSGTPREQLAEMGRAAAKAAESLSWRRTAARYMEIVERVAATRGSRR
jgi:glycosyltransferase involved in cell wall biosynthesis